jgi:glycerophosphoryl diester phosphodiesterase
MEKIYWQAHQSTSPVMPENTLLAFNYAWRLGGIPEADIRTTGDGKIICLHDSTLKRTTDAKGEIADLPVSYLAFDLIEDFTVSGQRGVTVPLLEDVFLELRADSQRLLYLDLKDVELEELVALIEKHKVAKQLIFAHNIQRNCQIIKELNSEIRTMLWIGGEGIEEAFTQAIKTQFQGLDQVQLHLYDAEDGAWPYKIDFAFIEEAYLVTKERGIDLEVLPFTLHQEPLWMMLDLGIRWFAIDYPKDFLQLVQFWQERRGIDGN